MSLLRASLLTMALALLLALGAYAWRGWYARYVTDDYCTAVTLRKLGFLGAMKIHRDEWSGRFAYYAIKAIPESIGPQTARVMPALMIALFTTAAVWAASRAFALRSGLVAFVGGAVVVFAAIDVTPDVLAVGGPLMWETGILTYMLPIVLYTVWAGLFFAAWPLALRVTASALVMLVAGGLSETSLAAQCALAACVFATALIRRHPAAIRIATAGLVATFVAAVLLASAPGNVVRMSEVPRQQPLVSAVLDAFRLTYVYVGSNIFIGGAAFVVVIVAGVLLGMRASRFDVRVALLVAASSFFAFVASLVPATWMLSMGPPPRALHVSGYFVVAMFLALGAAIGASRPGASRAVAALLLAASLIPLHSAWSVAGTIDDGRRAAAEIDRIVAIIRASPGEDVVIRSPFALAERLLVDDPEFWTNRCMSEFYGARSLRVTR